MQDQHPERVAAPSHGLDATDSGLGQRQSDRLSRNGTFAARHSGMHWVRVVAALAVTAWPLLAQTTASGFELLLRDGTVQRARQLVGDAAGGYTVAPEVGPPRRLAGHDLLAVFGVAAAVPALPAVHLAGGEVLYGAVVGGDAGGNRLDLQSPILGRVPIAVDRLAALAAADVSAPLLLQLPEAVEEALFVKASVGFDVLAGALHQFGEQGVRFQVAGNETPRWFRGEEFAALRLRAAVPRDDRPTATLLTRAGDRLGVVSCRWTQDGLACQLEGGIEVVVRAGDLAAWTVHQDVVHLSDLTPTKVVESGYEGDVVHGYRADHNCLGGPLVSAGRAAAKGLGVHSKSRLSFTVPAGLERFWTRVAFDDSAAGLGLEPRADASVLVNDKVVFERKDLGVGQAPLDTGLLVVRPGDTITLVVDHGVGRDLGDRLNWLAPVLLPAAVRRP